MTRRPPRHRRERGEDRVVLPVVHLDESAQTMRRRHGIISSVTERRLQLLQPIGSEDLLSESPEHYGQDHELPGRRR